MKILEKIVLVVYSYIILILSLVTGLLIIGWLEPSLVEKCINVLIHENIPSKVTLVINAIFILLSVKCIFFSRSLSSKSKERQSIVLQNENGKLMISKETIENLTNSVVKGFESIEDTNSKIIVDEDNNLQIAINLVVRANTVIKELTVNLQEKIKETVKNTLDLEVKQVNVRIKNFTNKKEANIE